MRFKDGVHPHGVEPELVLGLMVAESVWRDLGLPELVITSLRDGDHSATSLHFAGAAADLRTNDLSPEQVDDAATELKARLGVHYDVIVEASHCHLEWQPRKPV